MYDLKVNTKQVLSSWELPDYVKSIVERVAYVRLPWVTMVAIENKVTHT